MITEVNMVKMDDLEKRIVWLDSERQKDKKYINELQDSLGDGEDEEPAQEEGFNGGPNTDKSSKQGRNKP